MKGRGQDAISEPSASSPRKHTGLGAVCAPLVLGQHALKRSWYHPLLYHLQAEQCTHAGGWGPARLSYKGRRLSRVGHCSQERT